MPAIRQKERPKTEREEKYTAGAEIPHGSVETGQARGKEHRQHKAVRR